MLAYIIRRVFQSAIVLLVVGLVAFSMFHFVGDPVPIQVRRKLSRRLAQRLPIGQPLFEVAVDEAAAAASASAAGLKGTIAGKPEFVLLSVHTCSSSLRGRPNRDRRA